VLIVDVTLSVRMTSADVTYVMTSCRR